MQNPIVSRDDWLAARKQLLVKEKEFTQLRDRLSAERRALPWFKVEKPYVFDGPDEIATGEVYYNYEMRKVWIEEMSGRSVFYKDANGQVFHTYSSYGRGGEELLRAYRLLDLVPMGRNETGPNRNLTDWVRHHDRYGVSNFVVTSAL